MEDAVGKITYELWLQWGAAGLLILIEGVALWLVWKEYQVQLPKMISALVENGRILSDLAALIRDRDRAWNRERTWEREPPPYRRDWGAE